MSVLITFLWIVICIALQVLVFNHLPLAGGVILLYLYVAIKMPVEVSRPLQILSGFLIGLVIDIFCNTLGLHAFAFTTTMWMRLPLLHMFVLAEDIKTGEPTLQRIGFQSFWRFLLSILIVHCLVLYLTEAFTLFCFLNLLLKILSSIVMTFVFLIVLELVMRRKPV
ncbi:MAG: hypothetical protein IJP70_10295 [Bacteroidales bacterium]|nr:hypothetical protein [Bacteroidales bacterium]